MTKALISLCGCPGQYVPLLCACNKSGLSRPKIWYQLNAFKVRVSYAAVRSKAVVPWLIAAPIVCGGSMFGPCFVIQYFVS